MASIRPYRGKWRAEVERHGIRKSKLTETEEEARLWAQHMVAALDSKKKRYTIADQLAANGPNLVTLVPKCVLEACREIPHPQVDILEAAIPTTMASGVYFLLLQGDVIYVGQSLDVLHRVARHRREGRKFDAFSYIECAVEDLDRIEALYIKAFVPQENVSFGNYRGPARPPDIGRRAPRRKAIAASEESKSEPHPGTPAF